MSCTGDEHCRVPDLYESHGTSIALDILRIESPAIKLMHHAREKAVEPEVRRINWTLTCEQKQVVEESTKRAAAERRDDRYPEAGRH